MLESTRRAHLPVLILAAALLVGQPLTSQTQTDLDVLTRLAQERYAEGDLEQSADLYLEIGAREVTPQAQAKALFTASWLQHLAERPTQSLETLTRALILEPDQPFDAALYTPEFEYQYQQALRSARDQRAQMATSALRKAEQALQAERIDEARAHLEATIDLDPENPEALFSLAVIEMDAQDTTDALTRFEKVVALTYRDASPEMTRTRAAAQTRIGELYRRDGRDDDERQSFLEATRADPRQAAAWLSLGELLYDREDFAEAAAALERAHELLPDDREVTLRLTETLQRSGRSGQAEALLKSDLQRRPDDAELWLELGMLQQAGGQLGEAAFSYDRAGNADPEGRKGIALPAAIALAQVQLELENLPLAVDAARQATSIDPTSAQAWFILGEAQLALDDNPAAIVSLSRAADLQIDSAEPHLALGDAYLAAKQLQSAEGAYLRALSIDPDSSAAKTGLQATRNKLTNERAIVNGRARPRKPIQPKQIGLEFKDLDYEQMQLRGALVKGIDKKSPAARAGLRKGDLILWIGTYSVLSDKDFFQYIKRNPPGDVLDIEYLRDGRIHETAIQLR